MKSKIIIVLVLLLVLLGVFIAKRQGFKSIKDLSSSVEKSVSNSVKTVKSQVESKITGSNNVPTAMIDLPGDTVIALVFPAVAMAPAVNHLNDFFDKVKASSLGKKLEIDKIIEQGFEAAKASAQPGDSTQNKQPSLEQILKTFQNFDKLEVSLRAKTLGGKSTPLLKINASFKDQSYSKQLSSMLDGLVEMSKQQPGPQLKKDEQDPQTYVFNVKPPLAPVELLARMKVADKDISATIGIIAGDINVDTKVNSENSVDGLVSQSAVSKDAFAAYINVDNFRGLFDIILALVPGDQQKQQIEVARKAVDSSLGNYSAFAVNSIFDKGLNSKSCERFGVNSSGFSPFKEALQSASQNKSSFYRLLGPRTTFAARIDGVFAAATLATMLQASTDPALLNLAQSKDPSKASAPEISAAAAQLREQLQIAQDEYKKLKIKDIGLILNAPTVSFVPDVGLYLEHEDGVTIEQFGTGLQTIFKKLAPPSIAQSMPIVIGKDAIGLTQVTIPAISGYQLTFKAISPTQIFGSIQDTFSEEAKTLLAANESFIDDAKLAAKGVNLKVSDNDNFYYLSVGSLMPLVHQFAPFITMSKPELKINDAELTQFIDLFDFNLLITGKNSSPEDRVVCSAGQAVVF